MKNEFNDFGKQVNAEAEMIKYQEKTKRQINELSEEEFSKLFHGELRLYNFDESLDDYLYKERNSLFELTQKCIAGELRKTTLESLFEQLGSLFSNTKNVNNANKTYMELTQRQNTFYNQYERLLDLATDFLTSEIEERKLNGDYR